MGALAFQLNEHCIAANDNFLTGNLISDGTSAFGILIKSKCRARIFINRIFGAKNRKHFSAKCSSTYNYNIDNQLLTATKANITRTFELDAENRLYSIAISTRFDLVGGSMRKVGGVHRIVSNPNKPRKRVKSETSISTILASSHRKPTKTIVSECSNMSRTNFKKADFSLI